MIQNEDDLLNALIYARFYTFEGNFGRNQVTKYGVYEKCGEEGATVSKRIAVFDTPEEALQKLEEVRGNFVRDFKARLKLVKKRVSKSNENSNPGDDGPTCGSNTTGNGTG